MLKFEVRPYQIPRWMAPVLALAALALIPFALMLALGLAAAAVGFSVFRAFLPPAGKSFEPETPKRQAGIPPAPGSIIDAEYEIKDRNEKEQRG